MKVLVTGAAGQLGHDVLNELSSRGYEAVGTDLAPEYSGVQDGTPVTMLPYVQMDITDQEKADQVISTKASACQAKIYPVHRNSLKFPKFNGKYIDFYFQCDYDVDTKISIPFAAPYQMMNMTLAYQAMRMLEPETGIKKETKRLRIVSSYAEYTIFLSICQ